jgi:hypothetical protein
MYGEQEWCIQGSGRKHLRKNGYLDDPGVVNIYLTANGPSPGGSGYNACT